jgi:DNA-binding NtrC family response regulator
MTWVSTVQRDICLIEDDPIMGESLKERLVLEGFSVDWCKSATHAVERLNTKRYDAVVSDIRLPDIPGDRLYRQLLEDDNLHLPPTFFITGYGTIENAVELLKLGAIDYLTKPINPNTLIEKLNDICGAPLGPADPQDALGLSQAMQRLAEKLTAVSRHREMPVMITGESGSGKEVVARRLHALTDPDLPFIAVNCAAIPDNLIEAELFGFEKGAFTGAQKLRRGLFEQAEGGLLFLDEIGDMPLTMQAKLLRAIQDRTIVRIGGDEQIPVNFRLVCATHHDLAERVREQHFREDLYYRLNVIGLHVPPLRDRPEDILWLAEAFASEHAKSHPAEKKTVGVSARRAMLAHSWPGNVRELKHRIDRACVLGTLPTIESRDLFPEETGQPTEGNIALTTVRETHEREHIIRILETHGWRMGETADSLGVSRKTLWQKMKRLDIRKP